MHTHQRSSGGTNLGHIPKFRDKSERGLQVISVSSGKGGVGKTLTTVNLAASAARLGKKVLILDGDLGLANVDVVLGLSARYNINDVIDGHVSLADVILDGPLGVKIIPSGSGITRLTNLSYVERVQLFEQIQDLDEDLFDTLLIDTGAGISDSVLHLNAVADETVVVTTPEPHALTDAYALVKVMSENYQTKRVNLVVNMVQAEQEALKIHRRMADVAERFLQVDIEYLGHVPHDPQVQRFVSLRQAGSQLATHTVAGQAWNQLAQNLFRGHENKYQRSSENVWRELIWAQQGQFQKGMRI